MHAGDVLYGDPGPRQPPHGAANSRHHSPLLLPELASPLLLLPSEFLPPPPPPTQPQGLRDYIQDAEVHLSLESDSSRNRMLEVIILISFGAGAAGCWEEGVCSQFLSARLLVL